MIRFQIILPADGNRKGTSVMICGSYFACKEQMWLFVLIPRMKEHMLIKRRSLLHECGSRKKSPGSARLGELEEY